MTKKLRLPDRSDLVQIKDISELKTGMVLIYGIIPGHEKKLILESKKDPIEQQNYRRFWRQLILEGIVYKSLKAK